MGDITNFRVARDPPVIVCTWCANSVESEISKGFEVREVIRQKGFLSVAQLLCTYRDAQNHAVKKGNPLGDPSMSHTLRFTPPLPFHLPSAIIRVCLDLTGLFRNKDIRPVLMIRLARRGARKKPHYRIVVIEKARARNGRPVEVVGTYNPRTNPASVELKRDRVEYWVSKGAQMSERVNKLFSKAPAPVAAA